MGLIDTPPYNEMLTNDFVSFEQLGPGVKICLFACLLVICVCACFTVKGFVVE